MAVIGSNMQLLGIHGAIAATTEGTVAATGCRFAAMIALCIHRVH